MTTQGKGPHGPDGGREPFVQLGGNGRDEHSPSDSVKQAAGNVTPLRPQDTLNADGAAAMRIAGRAMRHGGRRGLVLLHLAGYIAGQSLGFHPAREARR